MGFPELRLFCSNQKNEIYNLGVVPDLQISKKVDFLMIYMIFFAFFFIFFWEFFLSLKICCKMGWEWTGEAETGSK